MKHDAPHEKRRHSLINLVGALLLVVAGALIGLLFFKNSPPLLAAYEQYLRRMEDVENLVLNLGIVWKISVAVLLLYALKSIVPFFPISVMCFITGATLPIFMSFSVNILGLIILLSIKYWWGRRRGGGQLRRLLGLNKDVSAFLQRDSKSKPWLLFVFRVVPSFPVNPVSQIYGAMGFDYADFVLISLLGFLPRLISYSIVGSNAFDPLSVPFLIPLVIIFTLSGILVIGINPALRRHPNEAGKKI
ncbi:MAG: VTT domain-containing protein [Oscillospiraceae bacterium]|jgi:uncharacterized membrane protein YdjX (TVP38/TMEM64 family)|nr:VTT domain-containing protein [Oscillospiraceae bacterium]